MSGANGAGPKSAAAAAWGETLPDWVAGLADQCAASSQNKVAKKMGRSAALISTVLNNKYTGDMAAVEDIYRGIYEAKVVVCPAMGNLPTQECRSWRDKSRKLNSANARSVMMFRACNGCPINGEAE